MISLWFPTIDRWNRFFASRRKIRGNRKTELRPRVYRTRVKFFRADNLWLETSGEKILRKYFLGSITPSVKYSIISPFWKLRITNRFVKMNYYSANQYSAEIKKRKKKSIPKYFSRLFDDRQLTPRISFEISTIISTPPWITVSKDRSIDPASSVTHRYSTGHSANWRLEVGANSRGGRAAGDGREERVSFTWSVSTVVTRKIENWMALLSRSTQRVWGKIRSMRDTGK